MLSGIESLYIEKGTHKGVVIESVLKKITDKRGIAIKESRSKGLIAIPMSLDEEAFLIINEFLKKSPSFKMMGPIIKQKGFTFIKPLYFCSEHEIYLYCSINHIKITKKQDEKDKIKQSMISFVNLMEQKHPEIKNAIVNAYLEINSVLK
ncbi:MAG: hypothetical protein V1660_02985 [archaeon]